MTKHAIPKDALDDRLGFVGTAGSGKTYNAAASVERVLSGGGRVVIPDPLGVWWGLRIFTDGKTPSPFNVVIFGGPHGDLALNEHAGAIIGETAAKMAESCILDLSQLGTKASERRFMLAFLTALYKAKERDGEPLHVVFDEADMWAPQRLLDKEGDAAKLLGMMETVVRRGRIKGFIPWLITQRPAVLSKDVLSQIDGFVAFKLTSSQDRDAIGDWVEGQADKGQWREIWASLPTMQRGNGIVWVPGRGILETVAFPEKKTFDSSKTPKRGEKRQRAELKPLDLDKLKEKLAGVQAAAKANDPAALRFEISNLKRQIAAPPKQVAVGIDERAHIAAVTQAGKDGEQRGMTATKAALAEALARAVAPIVSALQAMPEKSLGGTVPPRFLQPAPVITSHRPIAPARVTRNIAPLQDQSNGSMSSAARKILTAIVQFPRSSPEKVGIISGYSSGSGHFANTLGWLRTQSYVEKGQPLVASTEGGAALGTYEPLPTGEALLEYWCGKLEKAPRTMLRELASVYPNGMSPDELGERAGYSAHSGHFANMLGRLRTLELVERGQPLKLSDHLFQ